MTVFTKDLMTMLTRVGISFFIWMCVAYVHLMTGFLDTVKHRPDYQLGFNDYLYYFSAYSAWAIFSFVLFEHLKRVCMKKSTVWYVGTFFLGLFIWLPSYFVIDYSINTLIHDLPFDQVWQALLKISNAIIFFYTIVYALTFGCCLSLLLYKHARESQLSTLQLKARETENLLKISSQQLQLLQSQLSPHFLFNCLGAISALARSGDKTSLVDAVSKVGNLLRYTIESSKQAYIPISDELAFVDDYISLQKLRFGLRFHYHVVNNIDLSEVWLPPFLIQPLIENAFVHAVAMTENTADIKLQLENTSSALRIRVENTFANNSAENHSLGTTLSNLKTRLGFVYQHNFQFNYGIENSMYIATIEIPLGPAYEPC